MELMDNARVGKAGELRVASELLLRGYDVHLSIIDHGTDLLVNGAVRIQVKSAHSRSYSIMRRGAPVPCEDYTFSFKSWRRIGSRYEPHPLDVDFVILWAIDADKFLIVPASCVRGRYSIRIRLLDHKKAKSSFLRFINAWETIPRKE